MLIPLLPHVQSSSPSSPYYHFSNNSFEDFLEGYDGPPETRIKVLILSCGDLPFALNTSSLNTQHKVESITLTDESTLVFSRNVFLARVICCEAFDPSNQNDIEYLWDICYNMEWPEKTLKRFLQDLQTFDEKSLTSSITIPSSDDKITLKKVWDFWKLSSETNPSSIQILHEQRHKSIIDYIRGIIHPNQPLKSDDSKKLSLSQVWDWMHALTTDADWSHLPDYHHKAISKELRTYFETGNCTQLKETTVCINPTFLDPLSGQWAVSPFVHPFEEYLSYKEFPDEKDFLTSCKRILQNQVESYRGWLQEAEIRFYVGDAANLCYRGTWTSSFDIVDCTGLPDKLGLANVLNFAKLTLADNSHAVILTRSSPWQENSITIQHQSSKEFVEESLGASVEMIPTLYGVTLVNPVRLGNPQPLKGKSRSSIRLQWRNSNGFTNILADLSGAIAQFFEDLQSRCFGTPGSQTQNFSETFGPLTYCFLAASFLSRVELSEEHSMTIKQPFVASNLQLAWSTLQAWMDGSDIFQVKIQLTGPLLSQSENQSLRLVLNCNDSTTHFIQNFSIKYEECESCFIEFMLLKEHHLNLENTVAYLENSDTSKRLTSSFPLKDGVFSPWTLPMPFRQKTASDTFLICQEFEKFYVIDLPGIKQEEIILSNDRQPPCEAGHQINLVTNIVSQTLYFPWPLKMSDVHSSSDEETGAVRLILPKAIHEPHPFEWSNPKRLNLSSLSPWNEKTLPQDLNFHLSAQFNFNDLKEQILNEEVDLIGSELKGVREIIRTIFQSTVIDNNSLFVIRSKHDPKLTNLWFIRIHLPILVSPYGSPMLLLTANDHRLAQKLVDKGELKQEIATEDFKRIFVEGVPSTQVCPLFVQSDDEESLLRYLLRLNSTKIAATDWPIDQVPTGENSPWLLTFISPSYVDQAGTDADMENLVSITNKAAISMEGKGGPKLEINSRCSKCKQIHDNLKRCSRCRSAKYCSVECQRSDWNVHKLVCLQ